MSSKGFHEVSRAPLINKRITEKFPEETVIIGCPMLEDPRRIFEKLKMIAEESKAKKFESFIDERMMEAERRAHRGF